MGRQEGGVARRKEILHGALREFKSPLRTQEDSEGVAPGLLLLVPLLLPPKITNLKANPSLLSFMKAGNQGSLHRALRGRERLGLSLQPSPNCSYLVPLSQFHQFPCAPQRLFCTDTSLYLAGTGDGTQMLWPSILIVLVFLWTRSQKAQVREAQYRIEVLVNC